MFNSKKRVKDMAAPGTSSVPAPTAGNAEKLEIAKRLALRINAQKNLVCLAKYPWTLPLLSCCHIPQRHLLCHKA